MPLDVRNFSLPPDFACLIVRREIAGGFALELLSIGRFQLVSRTELIHPRLCAVGKLHHQCFVHCLQLKGEMGQFLDLIMFGKNSDTACSIINVYRDLGWTECGLYSVHKVSKVLHIVVLLCVPA